MPQFGLLIERKMRNDLFRVSARVVSREPDKGFPMGCSSFRWTYPKNLAKVELDGLTMDGFVSPTNDFDFIGFAPEYLDVYSIDQHKATRMAYTLNRVNKRLITDHAYKAEDVFASVAKSLDLSFVVKRATTKNSLDFSSDDWVWLTLAEGRRVYSTMIEEATVDAKVKNGVAIGNPVPA